MKNKTTTKLVVIVFLATIFLSNLYITYALNEKYQVVENQYKDLKETIETNNGILVEDVNKNKEDIIRIDSEINELRK